MGSRSSRNPNPQSIFYTASKFGLLGFSEALALDLRRHGIRVTSILPGIVATEFAGVGVQPWQLIPQDVAKAVADVLRFDSRVLPTILELRPARQPS
jgi:short-subunit dehydrogenase